jgi:hypothetical protein
MLCEAVTTRGALVPILRIHTNTKTEEGIVAISHLLEEHTWEVDSFWVALFVTPKLMEQILMSKCSTPDVNNITAIFSLFLLMIGRPEATTQATNKPLCTGSCKGSMLHLSSISIQKR